MTAEMGNKYALKYRLVALIPAWVAILKLAYSFYFRFIKYFKYPSCEISAEFISPRVELGLGVRVKKYVKIYGAVSINDHTFINEYTQIDSNTRSIGKYCSISHGVKIGMGPHPTAYFSTCPLFYEKRRGLVDRDLYDEFSDKGYSIIGNDVLISANAIVLAGVTVGDGAVIGAGSVVTKDVPPYAVVGGVPARILRFRFDDATIGRLLQVRWWDIDPRIVANHAEMGFSIHEFLDGIEREVALHG